MGIGTEAAQFPEKKHRNGIFVAVHGTLLLTHLRGGRRPAIPPSRATLISYIELDDTLAVRNSE